MKNKKNRATRRINQAFLLGEPSKRESAKSLSPLMCGFLLPGLMSVGLTSCGLVGNELQVARAPSVATTVTKVTPIAAKPDDVVSLTGNNFSTAKNLRVSVPLTNGDSTSVPLTITDSKTASFMMPEGAGLGVKDVKLTQGTAATEVTRFNLIADQASNQLPILIDDQSEICSTKKYIDRNGDEQVGTKDCATSSVKACESDGDSNCVVDGTTYKAAKLSNIAASDLLTTKTIAGITGTASPRPEDCSSNGQQSCVATSTYPAGQARGSWDMATTFPGAGYYSEATNTPTAGNIKSGEWIAGVEGEYPSVSFPLAGADGTADLDSATFDAKIKSATAFEYWTSSGTRQTGAGDSDISDSNIVSGVSIFGTPGTAASAVAPDPWDVRVGTTINGVPGKLKVNCRNRVRTDVFNYDGAIGSIGTSGVTSGTAIDIWDTIDDYMGAPEMVSGWESNDCGGVETASGDNNVWKDVTTAGSGAASCAGSPEHCTMQDKITGLWWSKLQKSATWDVAWSNCQSLNHNGQTGWRLPTQKELMEAYTHGIRSAASTKWLAEASMNNWLWSGSSVSFNTTNAWHVNLANGYSNNNPKYGTYRVVCVR